MKTYRHLHQEDQHEPVPGSRDIALELRDVVKTFGERTAVDHVNLQVRQGEVLAFLGPNGAGKTTTIEMCEGFQRPDAGSIRVLGMDPAADPDRLRQRIGIMLQGGGSYSGIRVEEMLELTASYCANPLDPLWLLDLLGLTSVRKTTYRRLSGGQQQRLSLALAIVGRPELVFFDEPTAGMDAQSRLVVWKLIRQLQADGVTVILTTHLMDEAEALADSVAIIDHGRIVATGTPDSLCSGSANASASITTARPLDLGSVPEALRAAVREVRPLHYSLASVPTPTVLTQLAQAAEAQGVLITQWSANVRTLEDVFLDLTGRSLRSS